MRVFAEVIPSTLGRGIHRIKHELRRRAPPDVQFVTDAHGADLQILDVIGLGSLDHLYVKDYVLLQYCYLTTERPEAAFWHPLFLRARLVMSYYDLHALVGRDDFAFYHAPLGVDMDVFYDRGLSRDAVVMTSGYEAAGEAIQECHEAVFDVLGGRSGGMIHLGPAFWSHPGVETAEGISDNELAICYSRCRYVSGLRRGEGFELPVVEGLACGARPVCFDSACFRQWFDGHAVFVPEMTYSELVPVLADVFRHEPAPVTTEERDEVLTRFDWSRIAGRFWELVFDGAA